MFRKLRFELIKKLLTSDERTLLRLVIGFAVDKELDLSGKSEDEAACLIERRRVAREFQTTALWV